MTTPTSVAASATGPKDLNDRAQYLRAGAPRSRDAIQALKKSVCLSKVVSETLPLKRSGTGAVARCPFHAENTPSFHVYPDHYHCFGCGAHGDIFDWLMATRRMTLPETVRILGGGLSFGKVHQPLPAPRPARAASRPRADAFFRCWGEGMDPAGTIVQDYLWSRGRLVIPEGSSIRFHSRCQRGKRDLPGGPEYWPAMLALMTHPITGQPVGVHRTYLRPDGSAKAPATTRGNVVLKPKMILGTWGVVRLGPDEDVGRALGIAEGIENALTASQIIGWGPVWAAGTQDQIARFPVLPAIEALTIFADADDSGVGLAAARTCADCWDAAGREARIYRPPAGEDWNDAARGLPHEPA